MCNCQLYQAGFFYKYEKNTLTTKLLCEITENVVRVGFVSMQPPYIEKRHFRPINDISTRTYSNEVTNKKTHFFIVAGQKALCYLFETRVSHLLMLVANSNKSTHLFSR